MISSGTRKYFIWAQISRGSPAHDDNTTYVVPANVDFGQPPEAFAVGARLHNLLQREVHPVVAVDEVAVERLSVLQFDEHGVALSGVKEA